MENLRLKYGDVELEIQDGYTIEKSSGDVSYNDFVCGWNPSYTPPEKYQEVKIINIDTNEVKAYGYINSYDFGEMRETDVDIDINLSLMSPLKLATLRTVIANGTYDVVDLIQNIILAPLIYDGFEIARIDIPKHQVTVNFALETIEYCMSNLSNKFNFWWFIDENKKIYIADIEMLKEETPKYIYDDNNMIPGLQYIKPITTSDDYANVVNLKNIRTYQRSRFEVENEAITKKIVPLIDERVTSLENGEEVLFKFPIDTNQQNITKNADSGNDPLKFCILLKVVYQNDTTEIAQIYVSASDNRYYKTSNIVFDTENKNAKFVLISDSFFSNLSVGFKYTGDTKIKEIKELWSDTALVWNVNKIYNDKGIQDKKGKISNTGIVETTVDMKGSWKTKQETIEIAKNYLNKNSLEFADQIELKIDKNILKVGDVIYINKFGINDNYIITSITETCRDKECNYIIKAQKSNTINNFVDVFRQEAEQTDDDKNYQIYVTHYNYDAIWQTTEVII